MLLLLIVSLLQSHHNHTTTTLLLLYYAGLYPLHVWALKNLNISVAGTAADYILG